MQRNIQTIDLRDYVKFFSPSETHLEVGKLNILSITYEDDHYVVQCAGRGALLIPRENVLAAMCMPDVPAIVVKVKETAALVRRMKKEFEEDVKAGGTAKMTGPFKDV
jgi:hypothetical protein